MANGGAARFWGVALIVFGVLSLCFSGFSYIRKEKILDVGPLEAVAEKRHTIPFSPILGGAALIAGMLVLGSRKEI